VDDWPLAKLIYKPPGVPASWGSLRAEPSVLGLLLGRIGGVREAFLRSPVLLPTALWGIQEGKADACLEASPALPDELRTAYLRNLVNSSGSLASWLAFPGAR
jgi:hypothetical protein